MDLELTPQGDLKLSVSGDISITDSLVQAVRIRLLWFLNEWRLGSDLGIPYFESLLVKNPNEAKIRHLIRDAIMGVEGVSSVKEISIKTNPQTRKAAIAVAFTADEETFREEVEINWRNMA